MMPKLTLILFGLFLALLAGLAFQTWRVGNYQDEVADLEYDIQAWSRGVTFLEEQLETKERLSVKRGDELNQLRATTARQKQQLQEIKNHANPDSCIHAVADRAVIDVLRGNAAGASDRAMPGPLGDSDTANTRTRASD